MLAVVVLAAACLQFAAAVGNMPGKYLIVTGPRHARVSYIRIRRSGLGGEPHATAVQDLITTGLTQPQGIVVDQIRHRLLVTDTGARRIIAYTLVAREHSPRASNPTVVVDNADARWVTVDQVGNIFYSDETNNRIMKLSAQQVAAGNTTASILYDGSTVQQVSAPGGIVTDNFYTYWVNKQLGMQVGSLAKAAVTPDETNLASNVQALTQNTDKSYGVCIVSSNIFYTQPENIIYGVRKNGDGQAVTINDRLQNPRGCAWDGDGTVFVADRGANAVYSFAGNMLQLGPAQVSKTVDFDDAFGVAVYSRASGRSSESFLLVLALACMALFRTSAA